MVVAVFGFLRQHQNLWNITFQIEWIINIIKNLKADNLKISFVKYMKDISSLFNQYYPIFIECILLDIIIWIYLISAQRIHHTILCVHSYRQENRGLKMLKKHTQNKPHKII